ncbi:recombinase family protein [Ensifer sp. NBAIM29]|nr:recombinase family protein [Ensifer sp. NBAIM29]
MRRGYIRLSKAGPSLEDQQKALASAGIDDFSEYGPVYVDVIPKHNQPTLPQRLEAIRSLEAGDELVVASASRLGTSTGDVLDAMKAIGDQKAALFDAETGETVIWHPDTAKVIEFARRAEGENRREIAAKMRRARVTSGKVGGAPERFGAEALAEAEKLWADPKLSSSEVARLTGINVRTLYRRLGDRGGKKFGSEQDG